MAYSLTGLSDTDISQNKPIKATQGQQLRDNIIGVAGGVSGAPKVVGEALGLTFTKFTFTATPGGITDIDARAKDLLFFTEVIIPSTATVAVTLSMRASDDNGSTWGSYVTFASYTPSGNDDSVTNILVLDVQTGLFKSTVSDGNLGKTNIDAVQIRGTASTTSPTGGTIVTTIGGVSP